jgi:hypothetical protein
VLLELWTKTIPFRSEKPKIQSKMMQFAIISPTFITQEFISTQNTTHTQIKARTEHGTIIFTTNF